MSNWKAIAYWLATGLFAAFMVLIGTSYIAGVSSIRETMAHLGYPPYILFILGPAKLLGVVGVLQTRSATLNEWAYAGFAIDLLGAAASHAFSGDPFAVALAPLMFLVLLSISYALRRDARAVAAVGMTSGSRSPA
jgi:hypothetical protein